jgi:hypothetical protein
MHALCPLIFLAVPIFIIKRRRVTMRGRDTLFMMIVLMASCTMAAWSYPGGITGTTRKTGGGGCAGCHSGTSIAGLVSISGPTTLKVGQTGTYTMTISSGILIGVDIAASTGTLARVSQAIGLSSGELIHTSKMNTTSVQFTWKPSATGSETIYAVGAKDSKKGGWGHAADFNVTVTPAGTTGIEDGSAPMAFALNHNYPNPFNPSTTIRFSLPQSSDVTLSVMNLIGEKVATLVSKRMEQGNHQVHWDASGIPSGMYFYTLEARQSGDGQPFVQTRKLVLVK